MTIIYNGFDIDDVYAQVKDGIAELCTDISIPDVFLYTFTRNDWLKIAWWRT